jgi:hypothetical protein
VNINQITRFAIIGAVAALIGAFGISRLFLAYATETYTLAIQKGGGPGIEAAGILHQLHHDEAQQLGPRGFLARSIEKHGGSVYTKAWRCAPPSSCEGFTCIWERCGLALIYAADFADMSYQDGIVRIPPPRLNLWMYALLAGVLIGGAVGWEYAWPGLLSTCAIIGVPLGLLAAPPLAPVYATALLAGVTGGIAASITKGLLLRAETATPRNCTVTVSSER